ncbi:MAG: hypothetical protein IIB16_05515 [Chloroflexi bacterium]|nr:hypothetical protein [Chloroflexota bacterium]
MANELPRDRLKTLRADGNLSLQRFAGNRLAVALLSMTPPAQVRRRTASAGVPIPSGPAGPQKERELADARSSIAGDVIDDERQVRAMAKEIKRLIVEDRRRGLGIGG